jgi:hypothetical protein
MKITYASGTPATLSETPGLLTFGTVSPQVKINRNVQRLLTARAVLSLSGCTITDPITVTLKLRCTSGTPADIANSTTTIVIGDIATSGQNEVDIPVELPPVIQTTGDSQQTIQLWGSISDSPASGDIKVSEASILVES